MSLTTYVLSCFDLHVLFDLICGCLLQAATTSRSTASPSSVAQLEDISRRWLLRRMRYNFSPFWFSNKKTCKRTPIQSPFDAPPRLPRVYLSLSHRPSLGATPLSQAGARSGLTGAAQLFGFRTKSGKSSTPIQSPPFRCSASLEFTFPASIDAAVRQWLTKVS